MNIFFNYLIIKFKVLIPGKGDSEESSENNNNILSYFKFFKVLINCI